MRVVVVGAGLAGLRTAERLVAAGADVTVLEASYRAGGRVRTVPFASGQYVETGAEWVDSYHHRLRELLDRFGVRTLGEGERWTVIRRWLHVDGELLDPDRIRARDPQMYEQLAAYEAIVESAADGITDASRPDLHPDAAAIDARSLADAGHEAGLGELAGLFARRDSQGEFAAEPSQVSLLFVAQQRAHQRDAGAGSVVRAHRVEGGFSQVAVGMAADLGDVVRYGCAVDGFDDDGERVTVHAGGDRFEADHLVLACSLAPVRAMRHSLPAPFSDAIGTLGYGTITKTAVQWPRRVWPSGYATSSGDLQRVYEPTADQPGTPGILMSYCGGDGGHQWAESSEPVRIGRAAHGMQVMHQIDDHPLGGLSRAWSIEPRYGGSYAVYRPGQVTSLWQALREPCGRVHLAGEHVATCTGYMEGALESGETVAARILGGG